MAQKFNLNKYENIFSSFRENVQLNTGINNFNSDSVIKSLIDPLAVELTRINSGVGTVLDSIDIKTASGSDLDAIGATYGVARFTSSRAKCSKFDNNFTFYVVGGTFGSINSGQDIVVPAGTKINTGSSLGRGRTFSLAEPLYLSASASRGYGSVRSTTIGSLSNVAANTIVYHEFSNYSDSQSMSLKCTNRLPITNGRDVEDDESYRVRIFNQYSSFSKVSKEAVSLQGLAVPGIVNQRLIKNWLGFGTSALFVFGPNKEVSQDTINFLQSKINTQMGFCSDIVVLPGVRVFLDLDLTIWINQETSARIKRNLESEIRRVISNAFVTDSFDQSVDLNSLVMGLGNQIPIISSVSNASDRSKIINAAYVRKNYGGGSTVASERVKLTAPTYSLKENEFLSVGIINIKLERV